MRLGSSKNSIRSEFKSEWRCAEPSVGRTIILVAEYVKQPCFFQISIMRSSARNGVPPESGRVRGSIIFMVFVSSVGQFGSHLGAITKPFCVSLSPASAMAVLCTLLYSPRRPRICFHCWQAPAYFAPRVSLSTVLSLSPVTFVSFSVCSNAPAVTIVSC